MAAAPMGARGLIRIAAAPWPIPKHIQNAGVTIFGIRRCKMSQNPSIDHRVGRGRILFFGLGFVAFAAPLRAEEKLQPWPSLLVVAPVGSGWQVSGEVIRREGRTSAFNPQHEYRAQLGHPIADGLVAWAGYVRFDTYPAHIVPAHEDQVIEQLNWAGIAIGRVRLSSRTRLEQRFVHGVHQTAWRIREQLRLTTPLMPRANAVTWAEPFVSLNRTPASPRRLDQFRAFAGISVSLSRRLDMEFGYLHQILHRPAGTFVNHALPVSFALRL